MSFERDSSPINQRWSAISACDTIGLADLKWKMWQFLETMKCSLESTNVTLVSKVFMVFLLCVCSLFSVCVLFIYLFIYEHFVLFALAEGFSTITMRYHCVYMQQNKSILSVSMDMVLVHAISWKQKQKGWYFNQTTNPCDKE